MKLSATKIFTFDMAHMLSGHKGLCSNVHGHTYRAEVEISHSLGVIDALSNDSSAGMIMDFSDLKVTANELFGNFDHAFVYNINNEEESEIAGFLASKGKKIFGLPTRTTAEMMAQYMFKVLNARLVSEMVSVTAITLYETPTSYVVYRGDECVCHK